MDITIWNLLPGFLIMGIPFLIFRHYQLGLNKDLLISLIRMVVQLSLVAIYLEWIFVMNNPWINTLWIVVMVLVGADTVVRRIKVSRKLYLLPFILSGLVSMLIIDSFFIGLVVRPDYFFDARYLVPISGMVLGNSLNHNIVGLTAWFEGMTKKKELYYFLLTNGGNERIAMRPFIQDALRKGLNPLIATMSVMGLISLPGMMTGQILGGSSPAVAIKYQIMIMLAIFSGCILTLILSIYFTQKKALRAMINV